MLYLADTSRAEAEADKHLDGRHAIEEAMSAFSLNMIISVY